MYLFAVNRESALSGIIELNRTLQTNIRLASLFHTTRTSLTTSEFVTRFLNFLLMASDVLVFSPCLPRIPEDMYVALDSSYQFLIL